MKSGTESAMVAMFSKEFQEWGQYHVSPGGQSELTRCLLSPTLHPPSSEGFKYDSPSYFDDPLLTMADSTVCVMHLVSSIPSSSSTQPDLFQLNDSQGTQKVVFFIAIYVSTK